MFNRAAARPWLALGGLLLASAATAQEPSGVEAAQALVPTGFDLRSPQAAVPANAVASKANSSPAKTRAASHRLRAKPPAAKVESSTPLGSATADGAPAESAPVPSDTAAQLMHWVVASGDNHGLPFVVVDKVAAEVFAFDSDGQQVGAAPALLGIAVGDDSAPGVGKVKLSAIRTDHRTTPAGRFVAKFGRASGHPSVLWVDYPNAISLHPVITSNPKERRLQRLNSPTAEDNRITFGCINVPTAFYQKVVRPLFKDTTGVVYILPETKPLNEVFLAFQPQTPAPLYSASR